MSRQVANRAKLRPRTIYWLNQASQAIRARLEQGLRPFGLTGIQYTVLNIVGSRDGISSSELSRRFFVTAQTMNEIVAGLEKRKLIERSQSAQSKRILTAKLTRSGRELLRKADAITDGVEEKVFVSLSDNDFQELRRIVGELLHNLRDVDGAAAATERKSQARR